MQLEKDFISTIRSPFETRSKIDTNKSFVTAADVHKNYEQNVLLHTIEKITSPSAFTAAAENVAQFRAEVKIHPNHSFFFEHERNHVPGLYLVEAGRQCGMAISHIFYDVPYDDCGFILDGFRINFENFASIHKPLFIHKEARDIVYRRNRLTQMAFSGHFYQAKNTIATFDGKLIVLPKAIMSKMERAADAVEA